LENQSFPLAERRRSQGDVLIVSLLAIVYQSLSINELIAFINKSSLQNFILYSGNIQYSGLKPLYQAVKNAANSNVQPANSIYDDLSHRFPGKTKAKIVATK
jgi:hypothetical protein